MQPRLYTLASFKMMLFHLGESQIVKVPPMGEYLATDFEQMMVDDSPIPDTTTDTQAPLYPTSSQDPNSSSATTSLLSTTITLA